MNPIGVIIYRRESSKEQGKGISLEAQLLQIGALCEAKNWNIVGDYSETASARLECRTSKRRKFNEATRHALGIGCPIIVASADRFSRTVATFDRFIAKGGQIYAADVGVDQDAIRAAIVKAEFEGDEISRRTLSGTKRGSGKPRGNPRLEMERPKAASAKKAQADEDLEKFGIEYRKAIQAGPRSDTLIVNIFNASGFLTPQGKEWTYANFGRNRRKLAATRKAPVHAEVAAVTGPSPDSDAVAVWNEGRPPMVDPDGWITGSGRLRLRCMLRDVGKDMAEIDRIVDPLCNRKLNNKQIEHLVVKVSRAEMRGAGEL